MLNRDIQYFDDPFRYAIIDNFFDQEDLEFVSYNIDKVDKKQSSMAKLNKVVQNQLKRRLKKDIKIDAVYIFPIIEDAVSPYLILSLIRPGPTAVQQYVMPPSI